MGLFAVESSTANNRESGQENELFSRQLSRLNQR